MLKEYIHYIFQLENVIFYCFLCRNTMGKKANPIINKMVKQTIVNIKIGVRKEIPWKESSGADWAKDAHNSTANNNINYTLERVFWC